MFSYKTKGTCAAEIIIDMDESNIIRDVRFIGGCKGNTQGVAALVRGMKVEDVINRLEGIRCGSKASSCPAQLAQALKENYNG